MASGVMVARVSAASHTCIAHQATHDPFSHFSPKRQASQIRPWRRVSSRERIAAFAYTCTHIAPRDTPLQVGASSFSSAPSWTSSRGYGTRRKKASIQTHAQSDSASQKGGERGTEGSSPTSIVQGEIDNDAIGEVAQEFDTKWKMEWIKRIIAYGLPALSIPMADPLMTTIDTIFVGQYCTTRELAALGPTGTLIAVMSYMFGFMGVATIKRISAAVADGEEKEVGAFMQQSLLMAGGMGIFLLTITQLFARPMLAAVATNADMMQPALTYLRIRILSQPAVILFSVSQSGLMALKDSVTPLAAIVTMCALNIFGDWLMISQLKLGVAGVAWATVISQYGALAVLLMSWAQRESHQNPFAVRQLPTLTQLRSLSTDFGVLWGISSLRTLCYSSLRVAATALGTLPCAAYTALYSVFLPLSFAAFPLRQSAMVFLRPHIQAVRPDNDTEDKTRWWARLDAEGNEILTLLLLMGVGSGLVSGLAVMAAAQMGPGLLTSDAAVLPLIVNVAVPAAVALALSGVMEISEGVLLIGSKADNVFLLKSMGITILLLNALLHLSGRLGWGLLGVWWSLTAFYVLRGVQPVAHILMRTMRSRWRRPESPMTSTSSTSAA